MRACAAVRCRVKGGAKVQVLLVAMVAMADGKEDRSSRRLHHAIEKETSGNWKRSSQRGCCCSRLSSGKTTTAERSRTCVGGRTEDEDAAVSLGLHLLMIDVEEEEQVVVVLLVLESADEVDGFD